MMRLRTIPRKADYMFPTSETQNPVYMFSYEELETAENQNHAHLDELITHDGSLTLTASN